MQQVHRTAGSHPGTVVHIVVEVLVHARAQEQDAHIRRLHGRQNAECGKVRCKEATKQRNAWKRGARVGNLQVPCRTGKGSAPVQPAGHLLIRDVCAMLIHLHGNSLMLQCQPLTWHS